MRERMVHVLLFGQQILTEEGEIGRIAHKSRETAKRQQMMRAQVSVALKAFDDLSSRFGRARLQLLRLHELHQIGDVNSAIGHQRIGAQRRSCVAAQLPVDEQAAADGHRPFEEQLHQVLAQAHVERLEERHCFGEGQTLRVGAFSGQQIGNAHRIGSRR